MSVSVSETAVYGYTMSRMFQRHPARHFNRSTKLKDCRRRSFLTYRGKMYHPVSTSLRDAFKAQSDSNTSRSDVGNILFLLLGLLKQGHLLACCPINVMEVYAGLRPREEAATEEFLKSLDYYHVTWPVARLAGLLKRDHTRKGTTLTVADATIAAVAIVHELTLMTDNVKDFPMRDLTLYPLP